MPLDYNLRLDQWEYHMEPVATPSTPNDAILDRMNKLGKERWEMCALYPSPHHILFKRKRAT
jgi:hypothetical protein